MVDIMNYITGGPHPVPIFVLRSTTYPKSTGKFSRGSRDDLHSLWRCSPTSPPAAVRSGFMEISMAYHWEKNIYRESLSKKLVEFGKS
jgi:hypothetical protein